MAGKTKSVEADGSPPYLLEAHYYSGGLRVRPLGPGTARPAWALANPERYVGLRDEFAFEREDTVVEFARFTVRNERLTWIGLFYRSPDTVFGDRGNHAGAGVWLRGHRARDAYRLIDGLAQIAAGVAKEGVDAVIADAAQFLEPRFLPSYLAPAEPLPAQLDGWRFSTTQLSDTVFYLVEEPVEAQAWQVAAEQITRMSVLPPEGAQSRALILVRSSTGGRATAPGKGFQTVKRGLASELIAALPGAIADIGTENLALHEEIQTIKGASSRAEADLREARAAGATLKAKVSELEEQIAESDILRRLATIDRRLQIIEEGGTATRSQIAAIARELKVVPPAVFPLTPSPEPNDMPEAFSPPGPRRRRRHSIGKLELYLYIAIALTVVGALIIATFDPFQWNGPIVPPLESSYQPATPPPAQPQ